jgi:hypothetical protein
MAGREQERFQGQNQESEWKTTGLAPLDDFSEALGRPSGFLLIHSFRAYGWPIA